MLLLLLFSLFLPHVVLFFVDPTPLSLPPTDDTKNEAEVTSPEPEKCSCPSVKGSAGSPVIGQLRNSISIIYEMRIEDSNSLK